MKKVKEYIDLVKKGLPNIDKIAEAVINNARLELGNLSEDRQEEIIKRRLICETCPLNSINAKISEEFKVLHGTNYETTREEFHCAICACPIKDKTASLSSDCGLQYYNDTHPENIQQLKWTKYTKVKNENNTK